MTDEASDEGIIARLETAVDGQSMPKAAVEYAQHLLTRLSQPVRVSVLGLPGAGKSQLINMFIGRRLAADGARLPTMELAWGPAEAMVVTGADGSVKYLDGMDFSAVGAGAAFLRLELPVEMLKRISLLEVVTNGDHEEIESAIDWAVRRTDIALWCSQAFDAAERRVWARVPDSLKDHAFLVLTKADLLSAEKLLSARVSELETIVAEEFHSLFAVATLQALRARAGSEVDEALFHASGGGAILSEILRHAERGRRADFDSAHMFLSRYQIKAAPRAVPEPAAVAEAPVAEADLPPMVPPARVEPAPSAPEEAAAPSVINRDLFIESVGYLKRRGAALGEAAAALEEGGAKPLVAQCVDAVEHLVDEFSQDETGCAATDAFIDELAEASDMMVLMQVEEGDGPAADAVTLLLQLRRDMEMQLAA
ncbi:MAG: hypothetical protein OIF48_06455 [Silicimonas sp.]|nr:hypothetical protein [Silicimonas sp.]